MPTYFISHSSADRLFIENELLGLLEALGIQCWYSDQQIETGQHWERAIKSSLEACDGLLLVVSPDSAASEWVRDEVNWALQNIPGRVFPVLIRDCDLTDLHIRLPRIEFADFRLDVVKGRNKLIALLRNVEFMARSRASALIGFWAGTIHQEAYKDGNPFEYPIEFRVGMPDRNTISGEVTISPPGHAEVDFKVVGGFLYERFLQFNYFSQDPGAVQFGSAILELDPQGAMMTGRFLGYGAVSQGIVTGAVTVQKM